MSRVGYNPENVKIKTDAGITIDMAFLAHFQVTAANAVAAGTAGVHAAMNLSDAAQEISTSITNPAVPRNLKIVGNVAGIDGKVTVNGTNYAGEEISEDFTANGTTEVIGNKAFKTVTSIELPIQDHTPVSQVETIAVTAGASAAGDLVFTVTAAGMTNSPKAVTVAVTTDDNTTAEVATKIRAALSADPDVSAFFTISGADADIVITAKAPAANDGTMAMALTDADSTSVTVGASGNTTAGVPYDKISVGWGDKLGLPFKLSHNTVLAAYLNNTKESNAPTIAVSATAIESNTIDLDSALNGTIVDAYLIV